MRFHAVSGCLLAIVLLAAPADALGRAAPDGSPLEPASTGGVERIDRALARLAIHKRLLVIGAHPDDEDNALLSFVSHGLGGEAAYFSLSRGEGGQNLIGTELGAELGVIRTGELLAARRVEGTRQSFARAFDFGYTRSLAETFERWPRELLQEDAVRTVRRFKPQVVVAIFPADERAGHGQHQASAVIAADVMELAGLPESVPELVAEGLDSWRPQALYRRAWRVEEATVAFELGTIDPHSGRSVGQLAADSRSRHRSQDMGRVQPIGRARGGLVWISGAAGPGAAEIFSGIDTRLAAIVASLEDAVMVARAGRLLEMVERLALQARRDLSPADLEAAVPALAEIIRHLDEVIDLVNGAGRGSLAAVELLAEKRSIAAAALAAAAGTVVDATADRETVALGGTLEVTASCWAAGEVEVEVRAVRLESPAGWIVSDGKPVTAQLDSHGVRRRGFAVEVPVVSAPTVPYFLQAQSPVGGDVYDWRDVPAALRGRPFGPPPLLAIFELAVADVPVVLEREVVFRYGDQAFGEVRRPLRAVPELEVSVEPRLRIVRLGGETAEPAESAELEVVLRSNVERRIAGRLSVQAPAGWKVPAGMLFEIKEPGGSVALAVSVEPPAGTASGRYQATVQAMIDGGGSAAIALRPIEYPHIRPTPVPRRAEVAISAVRIELPPLDRVGYIRGASDRVPEVLIEIGVPVETMTSEDLDHGDLDRFDAIVVGSRAYEIDKALGRGNGRLLEYARRGGTLVVQYQQYQFVSGGYAPYPLEIDRPHGRVTDETAAVRLLAPEHSVFHYPNVIQEGDWSGWVQERGLYFAANWDERYRPLLAMADAGRQQERGALLVAPLGAGTYVYTGLSFFRQLPAGVPGALRLFVNLLGLGR